MPAKRPSPSRKPRADAQRNRERILEAAKAAFRRSGTAGLEEIGRAAGVGPGTLYRHFPTREALIVAVFQGEVAKLVAAGGRLADSPDPLEAVRAWMLLFVDYVAEKHLIAPAFNSVAGGSGKLYVGARAELHAALQALVRRAAASGALRRDVAADDLLRALIGLAHVTDASDWKGGARRLVDLLIAGAALTSPAERNASQTRSPR